MTRPPGMENKTNYHYVTLFRTGGYKCYKTNIDLKRDLNCSYKTIQNFLKSPEYESKKFKHVKSIRRINIPIKSMPIFE
jgi:hypothetical protein